jgi:hypothetical protein
MSTEANKALAKRVVEEIYSQGDLGRVDEFLALDMVVYDPDKELRGRVPNTGRWPMYWSFCNSLG